MGIASRPIYGLKKIECVGVVMSMLNWVVLNLMREGAMVCLAAGTFFARRCRGGAKFSGSWRRPKCITLATVIVGDLLQLPKPNFFAFKKTKGMTGGNTILKVDKINVAATVAMYFPEENYASFTADFF